MNMVLAPAVQVLLGLLIVSALMTVLWFVQRRTGNAGIVDAGWAASIGLLGIFYATTSDGYLPRRVLVAVLIGIWSARLAIYILLDRVLGHPEEGRYRTLRASWGAAAGRRLFFFFQNQALAASFFALPVLVAVYHPVDHWTGWDLTGVLIWCVSVGNTVLADRQLARFKRRPESRGKTCREGWWRYSRHPNYFFEWLHWWSYVALAVGASYWWGTLLAPAAMLYFLLRVTGIPPTEAQALASRGEDYRQYQRTTSVFIPWFPKTETHRNKNQEG
jgi:steroid 5-alpha reductase family enzyme